MSSLFDKIYNKKMSSILEVATKAQDKAIIDDLNAKIQSLPPTEKGPIMDLLTSLQNMGGRLVATAKGGMPGIAKTPETPNIPGAPAADAKTTEPTPSKSPEAVKPPSQEEIKQKTAQNVALAQAKAAGDVASGYAKG